MAMGAMVTASQAGYLVRKNERAVRWHIGKGHLTPQTGDDGHTRLDVDELATIRGWRVDPARLAELTGEQERTADALVERVRLLERRLDRLEKLILRAIGLDPTQTTRSEAAEMAVSDAGSVVTPTGRSERRYDALSAPDGVSRGEYLGEYQPRRAVPTMRLSSGLPDELVSAAAFAAQHGIAESTLKKAMQSGRLPAQQGHWKHGRAYVTWALDADGRAAFFALYGGRADFARCVECPH